MRQIIMFAILILSITVFFVSCNASILMTNGEIIKPPVSSSEKDYIETKFSKNPTRAISATKSYYSDSIIVRWNAVEGADYYTIERAEHSSPSVGANEEWKSIMEAINGTQYTDKDNLKTNVYYSYRVTAHTYMGERGEKSSAATGTILSSPVNISASKGTSIKSIELEWDQMPYVESYKIYKSTQPTVIGLESEYVATVMANSTSLSSGYSYQIDETKERGKELYFAIEGIGPTGEAAAISLPRSGYTFIPGAPTLPNVAHITKGDDTASISIQLTKVGDDDKFIIKRFSPGSSEIIVYSSEYKDTLPEENGFYVFTDTDVKKNVEYTYSVIAYNDIGSSPARTVTGYLLSPVKKVSLNPVIASDKIGYEFSFVEPVGAGDSEKENSYSYDVTVYSKDGNIYDKFTVAENESGSYFFSVDREITEEKEKKEISYISVTVNSGSLTSNSTETSKIPMLSSPVLSISATKNKVPESSERANSNGVYPVTVSWESDFDGERVLTRKGSDGSEKTFKIQDGKTFVDTSGDILVKYNYFIDTADAFGRSLGAIKHSGDAYGAITPEKLADLFESVCLKPWERQDYVPLEYRQYWKKSEIATKVGYGNASDLSTQTKALGSASDRDHFRGGSSIDYVAEMEGIGGAIYFSYNDFGESPNMSLTGKYEMHVNASGTGSASSSGLKINGMYDSYIKLDKVTVSKKTFVGSYIVGYQGTEYEVAIK